MTLTIVTDRERLDSLRRRLAAAERASVVTRIQADVNDFAEYAPEPLLIEVAELQDRCAAKAERLGGDPAPKQSRKVELVLRRSAPPIPDAKIPGMMIRMHCSPWVTDELGNRSRMIHRADEPVP
jgi:hypothetical protein